MLSFTAQHELRREQFLARAVELEPIIERFFWYHTIDLGDGLVTPGCYDYRETVKDFHFPSDLRGKKVLDVGSATGFFAFSSNAAAQTSLQWSFRRYDSWMSSRGKRSSNRFARSNG